MELSSEKRQQGSKLKRIHFDEMFSHDLGRVVPKVNMLFNGVAMGPSVCFEGSGSANFNLKKLVGKYFDVELDKGVYVVKKVALM